MIWNYLIYFYFLSLVLVRNAKLVFPLLINVSHFRLFTYYFFLLRHRRKISWNCKGRNMICRSWRRNQKCLVLIWSFCSIKKSCSWIWLFQTFFGRFTMFRSGNAACFCLSFISHSTLLRIPVTVNIKRLSYLSPSNGNSIVWSADSWRRRNATPELSALPNDGVAIRWR